MKKKPPQENLLFRKKINYDEADNNTIIQYAEYEYNIFYRWTNEKLNPGRVKILISMRRGGHIKNKRSDRGEIIKWL
ncbi:MAG: hypothetical protein QXF12_02395 [Candidatus Aenigmatarchaeota archaeon]